MLLGLVERLRQRPEDSDVPIGGSFAGVSDVGSVECRMAWHPAHRG